MSPTSLALPCALICVLALPGCDRKAHPVKKTTNAPPVASAPASSAKAASAPTMESPSDGRCPVGQWEYDYSDQFLESMTQTAAYKINVVKKSGRVVCTISSREAGTYDCKASEEGVENVMEAEVGGTKMQIQLKIAGDCKVSYESAGPNRWRTTGGNFDNLKVQATATLGDKKVPLPDFKLFRGWDKAGTVLEYKCEDGMLLLKPEQKGPREEWLHLKPLP